MPLIAQAQLKAKLKVNVNQLDNTIFYLEKINDSSLFNGSSTLQEFRIRYKSPKNTKPKTVFINSRNKLLNSENIDPEKASSIYIDTQLWQNQEDSINLKFSINENALLIGNSIAKSSNACTTTILEVTKIDKTKTRYFLCESLNSSSYILDGDKINTIKLNAIKEKNISNNQQKPINNSVSSKYASSNKNNILLYVNTSFFKEKVKLINELKSTLDYYKEQSKNLYLFISNGDNPVVTNNYPEAYDIVSTLLAINQIQKYSLGEDLKQLNKTLDKTNLRDVNNTLYIYFSSDSLFIKNSNHLLNGILPKSIDESQLDKLNSILIYEDEKRYNLKIIKPTKYF